MDRKAIIFLITQAVLLFSFLCMAISGEDVGRSPVAATASGSNMPASSPPSSFSLPVEEVYEWRLLQAETRALQAESALAIRERSEKLQALLALWKERYKIDDMQNWSLNMEKRSIEPIEHNSADRKP